MLSVPKIRSSNWQIPKLVAAILALVLLNSSCQRRAYVVEDFELIAKNHHRIAVLPFEVIYTGRPDPKLTATDIKEIRQQEALAFQQNLIDLIGERGSGRFQLNVDLLGARETLARLEAAGIDPFYAQDRPALELTQALGVDAVVMTRVNKHRSLTTIESAAVNVLAAALPPNPISAAAGSLGRTYRVSVSVSAIDETGTILYNDAAALNLDYRTPVDEGTVIVNRRVVHALPYFEPREKKSSRQ